MATTVMPSRGRGAAAGSERAWKSEHMFGDVGEDQIRRDRRHLIETRLAELALDVVFAGETESPMRLQTHVRGLPRRLGGQILRHVGLCTAGLVSIIELAGLVAHEARGFDVDIRLGDRKLHALIAPDRAIEYHTLVGVLAGAFHEPVAVADALGGNQSAFGIQSIQYV